jgi:hypothetical protein
VSVWDNVRWARTAPVVRRADGEPDGTAHHVLLALATFSDREGRCRPSLPTLADASYKTQRVTADALKRLVLAGLIKSDGEYGKTGVTVWVLMLGLTRSDMDGAAFEDRRTRAKRKAAERQQRWREAHRVTLSDGVTGDVTDERYVTLYDGVTSDHVTPSESVTNAVGERDVTLFDDTRNAANTVTTAGQSPNRTIEEPVEDPGRTTTSPAAKRERASEYTPAFEEFWARYERKGAKRKAFGEWQRALKRGADTARILAAIPAYFASRPDQKFRKDAERWLAGDCWESEHVPAGPTGHQTYRNPDQAAYEEGWR